VYKRQVPLVRTLYDGELPAASGRVRSNLAAAARVVCHTRHVAETLRARASEYGIQDPEARVVYLPPPIDTERFDPAKRLPSRRELLEVPEDGVLFGIVARMQTHRRFEVLLEAFRQAQAQDPRLHLVIVGRGTHQEEVARRPVRELGLSGAVHFSGYVSGDDYVATLQSFDVKVFMVPGSDGTCRAVREALALGLPALVTQRGILPELVRHEVDGIVTPGEVEDLRDAFLRLGEDPALRERMSAEARAGAEERFAYPRLVERLDEVYRAASEA